MRLDDTIRMVAWGIGCRCRGVGSNATPSRNRCAVTASHPLMLYFKPVIPTHGLYCLVVTTAFSTAMVTWFFGISAMTGKTFSARVRAELTLSPGVKLYALL